MICWKCQILCHSRESGNPEFRL